MEEDESQQSITFSDSNEAEVEEKPPSAVIKSTIDDVLPPPNPLIPKTLVPSEPPFHAQEIPFE